jgi:hypothetical protein
MIKLIDKIRRAIIQFKMVSIRRNVHYEVNIFK